MAKLNLNQFTAKKVEMWKGKVMYRFYNGVLHREGVKVACNRFVMIAEHNADYDPILEGKIITNDGIDISDKVHYPRWQSVVPMDDGYWIDFDLKKVVEEFNKSKDIKESCSFLFGKIYHDFRDGFYFHKEIVKSIIKVAKVIKPTKVYLGKSGIMKMTNDQYTAVFMNIPAGGAYCSHIFEI